MKSTALTMKARKRMFLEIKPDIYVNTDRILFCGLDEETKEFAIWEEVRGNMQGFCDVDTEKIRNFLRGADNGRTEND